MGATTVGKGRIRLLAVLTVMSALTMSCASSAESHGNFRTDTLGATTTSAGSVENQFSTRDIGLLRWDLSPGGQPGSGAAATVTVGHHPQAVIYDGHNVWVSNGEDATVSKIDPATNTVTATVKVGVNPAGMAYDGVHVWVANSGSNTVSEIDATTNAVTTTISVGSKPLWVTFDGSSIWVSNSGDKTVSKVDPASDAVATIAVGDNPAGMAFDGTSLWIANSGGDTVVKVDPVTNTVVAAAVTTDRGMTMLAFDGTNIWAAAYDTLHRIDPTSNAVTATTHPGYELAGMAYDGTNLWLTDHDNGTLNKIDSSTGAISGSTPVAYPTAVAYDGANMWVTDEADGTVAKILPTTDIPSSTSPSVSSIPVDESTSPTLPSGWAPSPTATTDCPDEAAVSAQVGVTMVLVPSGSPESVCYYYDSSSDEGSSDSALHLRLRVHAPNGTFPTLSGLWRANHPDCVETGPRSIACGPEDGHGGYGLAFTFTEDQTTVCEVEATGLQIGASPEVARARVDGLDRLVKSACSITPTGD